MTAAPRFVAHQTVDAVSHEPLLAAPAVGLGFAGLAHDGVRSEAGGGQSTTRARQTCFCGLFRSKSEAKTASIERRISKTGSAPGDLPALGSPTTPIQRIGGSFQPRHGETHRALPISVEAPASTGPTTYSGGADAASAAVAIQSAHNGPKTSSGSCGGGRRFWCAAERSGSGHSPPAAEAASVPRMRSRIRSVASKTLTPPPRADTVHRPVRRG